MPKGETAGHADHAAQGGLLAKRLIESIDRDGPLTIAQYMAACLADRRHGYWQKPSTIGGSGDFITAPEISQIFGELIGLWCALVWQSLGEPTGVRLVELGPGRGTLMADALRAARQLPCFLAAASVHLIETSRTQRELQRRTLSSALAPARRDRDTSHQPTRAPAIDWHETLLGVPEGPAIIVANEFLDALPVRQLIFTGRAWHERVVACGGDGSQRRAEQLDGAGVLAGREVCGRQFEDLRRQARMFRREAPQDFGGAVEFASAGQRFGQHRLKISVEVAGNL